MTRVDLSPLSSVDPGKTREVHGTMSELDAISGAMADTCRHVLHTPGGVTGNSAPSCKRTLNHSRSVLTHFRDWVT